MSGPRRPQDDAISLSSDSSPEPSPVVSPKVMPSAPSRMSVNNYGQPVRSPDFNRPLSLPGSGRSVVGNNQIDLTKDDDVEDQDDAGDEDEELRRAIALSLQSHDEEKKRQGIVKHPTEAPKEALKTADTQKSPSRTVSPPPQHPAVPASTTFGLLGLDRKAMEVERLARLKRKREEGSSAVPVLVPINRTADQEKPADQASNSEGQSKRPKTSGKANAAVLNTRTRPISPPPTRAPTSAAPKTKPSTTGPSSTTTPPSSSTPLYPHGAILLTPSPSPSPHPTISFPTLLAPHSPTSHLTSALLSSFTIDFDWLLPHFNTQRTSFVFVLHTASPAHRAQLTSDFEGVANVKLVFPNCVGGMKGGGTMHGKLNLLFFSGTDGTAGRQRDAEKEMQGGEDVYRHGRCRLVIPTGNLVGHDWGVGGVMENLVFVADLPMLPLAPPAGAAAVATGSTTTTTTTTSGPNTKTLPQTHPQSSSTPTPFQRSLTTYLTAQNAPSAVLTKLERADFGDLPRDLGFVSSVAGFHYLPTTTTRVSATATASASTSTWMKRVSSTAAKGEGGKSKMQREGGKKDGGGTRLNDSGEGTNEEVTQEEEAQYDGTGLWNLSATVRELGLLPLPGATSTSIRREQQQQQQQPVQLDYATSSLGALTGDFLPSLYDAVRGLPPRRLSPSGTSSTTSSRPSTSTSASASASASTPASGPMQAYRSHTTIYFPSAQTVASSLGGTQAAGTICFQEKWWERGDFPREIVRDCVSEREGMLGHYKLLLVPGGDGLGGLEGRGEGEEELRKEKAQAQPGGRAAEEAQGASENDRVRGQRERAGEVEGPESPRQRRLGWAYVGSANCSESAWGRAVFDKSTKTTKLTVRNWECGIAFSLVSANDALVNNGDTDAADGQHEPGPVAGGIVVKTSCNNSTGGLAQPPGSCGSLGALGRAMPVPMRMGSESLVMSGKAPWFFGGFGGDQAASRNG